MSVEEHKKKAQALGPLRCAVFTISDVRKEDEDVSGKKMVELISASGHQMVAYQVVPNDATRLKAVLEEKLSGDADLILTSGGTGLSRRDQTIEVVTPLLDKVLPGFGELFRFLSYQQMGSAALMSRALLGLARGKIVACLPGSPQAVELAVEKLILPEIQHLLWEARR